MEKTLVIMAAGGGSRYGGLKQVDRLILQANWIIDYSIFTRAERDLNKLVFVIKEEIDTLFRAR